MDELKSHSKINEKLLKRISLNCEICVKLVLVGIIINHLDDYLGFIQ